MTTLTLDPALRRLVGELEANADEPQFAHVWLDHMTRPPALVPLGIETEIRLGAWTGPPTRLAVIPVRVRLLADGRQGIGHFEEPGDSVIVPGLTIVCGITIPRGV
jgi:hypothetical protein